MSAYESSVRGHLAIEPPLSWSQIKASRFYVEGDRCRTGPDVILQILQSEVETETGFDVTICSNRVIPYTESSYGVATILEDVKELVASLKDHVIRGELVIIGEDAGDVRRIVVDDSGAHEERARFLWPTGEEVVLP